MILFDIIPIASQEFRATSISSRDNSSERTAVPRKSCPFPTKFYLFAIA